MKTRGRPSNKSSEEAKETTNAANPKVQLGADEANPPHIIVLPKNTSKNARIVTLQDPKQLIESRYFICPEKGFYELKILAAPKTTPRSWLLSQDGSQPVENENPNKTKRNTEGYIMRHANLTIATPIDPLFFILPYLTPTAKATEPAKRLFLSSEDYFDKMISSSPEFGAIFRSSSQLRSSMERRMAVVCDTVEAGDEIMYRINEGKLLDELLKKAKRMTEKGLPPSIEEKLVRKVLEIPILSIVEESSSHSLVKEEDEDTSTETPDTQSTADTAASSFSEASTAATSISENSVIISEAAKPKTMPTINAPEGVPDLLRLRTALFFILSSYVTPHISESIKKQIMSATAIDFGPLDSHLSHLAKLRQEALAARSLGDYSRKRVLDEEETEVRAEKRRKEEEDKKRKANESRGVKALKKVNVSGMKKMSDFFKKK